MAKEIPFEKFKGTIERRVEDDKKKMVLGWLRVIVRYLLFDGIGQRIINLYVVKTEKREAKLANIVIDKIGRVAQEDVWKWWNNYMA